MLYLSVSFVVSVWRVLVFFFFKQKTAYEMRISDWSSDVCSSDLIPVPAPLNNHAHASTTRMMRKTREIARLRTRTAFNSEALGPNDAMAVEMHVGELAVARRMLQPHRIDGPAGPGTGFGHLVLKTIWNPELCPACRTVARPPYRWAT